MGSENSHYSAIEELECPGLMQSNSKFYAKVITVSMLKNSKTKDLKKFFFICLYKFWNLESKLSKKYLTSAHPQ